MKRVLLVLVLVAVAPLLWLWPHEEPVATDELSEAVADAEPVPAVEFAAKKEEARAPFVERWELAYPGTPPPQHRLALEIGAVADRRAAGRLTSLGGDSTSLLERTATVLFDDPQRRPTRPATAGLDLTLELLGERLSQGQGAVGSTVIAGAFVTEPAGSWRAYKVTFGPDGPQCFLGLHPEGRSAVLLSRSAADGPAIQARLRALLQPSGT